MNNQKLLGHVKRTPLGRLRKREIYWQFPLHFLSKYLLEILCFRGSYNTVNPKGISKHGACHVCVSVSMAVCSVLP
jgi:hypothetical protein